MLRRSLAALVPPDDRETALWHHTPVLLAVYLLACVVVMGGVAAFVLELRVSDYEMRERELLTALEQRELARHEVEAEAVVLRRALEERNLWLDAATAESARLSRDLALVDAERLALETERRLARERAQRLDRRVSEAERWLATAEAERLAVEHGRTTLEDRIADLRNQLELAVDEAEVLRQHVAMADGRLARLERERELAQLWLTDWIGDRLAAIETVLRHTGIEADRLIARAGGEAAGQGGPFLPSGSAAQARADFGDGWWPSGPAVDDEALTDQLPFGLDPQALSLEPSAGRALEPEAVTAGLGSLLAAAFLGDIDRLEAAERVLAAVPLGAPFDSFHLTSRFGQRVDPLSRRRAMHHGLDFGAPSGSEVLATSPGTVIRAGRAGSYGIMVELDHGHGITTRYAHLSRTLVEVGQSVGRRAPIGVIGTTGRSTGRHLHYEVRVDNEPRDPARFLAAGRQLVEALGS